VDVRVEAGDVLPIGKVKPFVFQGVAQFQQRVGAAHLLQASTSGLMARMLSRTLALASAALAERVSVASARLVFDVVGSDAEGLRTGEPGAEQQSKQDDLGSGRRLCKFISVVISGARCKSKGI